MTKTTKELAEGSPSYINGPYSYYRDKDGVDETWNVYESGNPRPLISIAFWDEVDRTQALARLFAAAPTMLDALRHVDMTNSSALGSYYTSSDTCRLIREAILMAEEE